MPIDIICMLAFIYGFWRGYNQGIISTVFNILAYVFGVVLAFKMTPTATNILEQLFHTKNPMMFLAAFVVNFIFILFMLRQAAKGFEGILRSLYIGIINQALGGALMGILGVLIFSVLVWFGAKTGILNDQTLAESRTYPFLKDMPGKAKAAAIQFKPLAEDVWETSLNWMNRLEHYGEAKTEGKTDQPRIYQLPDDGRSGIENEPEPSRPYRRPSGNGDEGSGIEE